MTLPGVPASADPAQRAAIIADWVLDDWPEHAALVARRCILLHWFDPRLVWTLLPDNLSEGLDTIYAKIEALPFVEKCSLGLRYHDLTREGLLTLYALAQPELLVAAAALAAPAYEALEDRKQARVEAFFCYTVAADSANALALLDSAFQKFRSSDDLSYLGYWLEAQDEAEEMSFVAPLPLKPRHWVVKGAMRFLMEQHGLAIPVLTKAIELDPENVTAFRIRGLAYRRLKQYECAFADYARAIDLDEDSSVHLVRADTYVQLEQYELALADLDRAIELDPENVTAFRTRGVAYGRLEQYELALADLDRAIELDPEDATAYNARGSTYLVLEQYERALADLDRAIELDPEDANAYRNRGVTYRSLEQYERALVDYRRAIELDPQMVTGCLGLVTIARNLRRFDLAIRTCLEILAIQPGTEFVHNNLGYLYIHENRLAEAEGHLVQALALDPRFSYALLNLGIIRWRQQKSREATLLFREALEIVSDSEEPDPAMLGWLQVVIGKAEGLDRIRDAAAISGESVDLYNLWDWTQAMLRVDAPAPEGMEEILEMVNEELHLEGDDA